MSGKKSRSPKSRYIISCWTSRRFSSRCTPLVEPRAKKSEQYLIVVFAPRLCVAYKVSVVQDETGRGTQSKPASQRPVSCACRSADPHLAWWERTLERNKSSCPPNTSGNPARESPPDHDRLPCKRSSAWSSGLMSIYKNESKSLTRPVQLFASH